MPAFDYRVFVTGDCQSNNSGAITISLSGGTPPYSVNWVNPNLNYDNTNSSSTRSGLSAGNYLLQLNDSTLPVNQEFLVNVSVSSKMCVSIDNSSDSTCGLFNGSVTGSSDSFYSSSTFNLYSGSGAFIKSTVVNTDYFVFNSLSAGTYYVVGQDIGGCTGRSETFLINDSSDFDFGIFSVANTSCDGQPNGKLYVTGQTGYPPYTYLWSNGFTGNTLTGLTEGGYSVSVTDSKGCNLTKSAIVDTVEPVGFGFATPITPTCFTNNGSILFYTTGGTPPFCYSASTGNFTTTYSREFNLTGLSAGIYSIYVRDASLCSYNQSVSLLSASNISSVDVSTDNSYCSNNDGKVTLSINGGASPYSYFIINPSGATSTYSNNFTAYVFTGLSSGTYTVGVTDASGCSFSQEVVILTQNRFTFSATTTGTTCGGNNGTINIYQISAGTAPYSYYLDDIPYTSSISAYTFSNVSSGQHTVGISDATGCYRSMNVFVPQSTALDFSLSTTSCGEGSDGKITAFINSGNPPFTFQWSSNVSGNPQNITATGLTGGSYSLTITDSSGCSLSRTAIISCPIVYSSYETYSIFDADFQVGNVNKRGMFELLNEGFSDLTTGHTGCTLVSAVFKAEVTVNPSGYTGGTIFYTGYTRTDVPADNLWYDAVENLLLQIPGISSVDVDPISNTMRIISSPSSNNLNGQIIEAKLKIEYDILCQT